MDYNNHNTTLRTNKHLNFEERFYLEKRIVLGDSIAAISRSLGRSRTTIYTELKRGTVIQIRQGKSQLVYLADSGQATYERQRVGSFNTMRIGAIESFINWIESKTLADHWSFDAAVGYAKHKGLFMRNEMVCTKTLYNYLHKGVLGIKAIDLPLVVRRSQRKSISRKHKQELGKSIELHDSNIEMREEFGHWELDTVRRTKERHNGLLRRCIPKGMPIKSVSEETIQQTLQWCNNLSRKLLNYRIPLDVFLEEVNRIIDFDAVQFHIAI